MPLQTERTALLFLDFQVDVCAEGGKLMRSAPEMIKHFERVRANAAHILELCRELPSTSALMYAHVGRVIDYPHISTKGAKYNRLEDYLEQHQVFAKGTPGAMFVEELCPTVGEQIIWKHGMSAFSGSDLSFWLGRRGIDTIVLAGVVSHYGVLATAFDAIDRGLRVVILEDCCTSRDARRHEAAMELLHPITEFSDSQTFCEQILPNRSSKQSPNKPHDKSKVTTKSTKKTPTDWKQADFVDINEHARQLVLHLEKEDEEVTDEELIICIEAISESLSMKTNAEMAAFHIFSAAIPMCYHRRHLAVELFPLAMFGLLAMFYDCFDDQLAWLKKHARQKEPFGGLEPEMLGWLRGLIEEETYLHKCFQTAVWWEHVYSDEEEIPGLLYIPNFLKPRAEKQLLKTIDQAPWSSELKRRVQHYGYLYDYKARSVDASMFLGPLPDWIQKMAKDFYAKGFLPRIPDQVIVNEYLPGQGISAHIDCVPCFHDTIALISLGSPCVMDFTHAKRGTNISKWLPSRSLVVLTGEARYDWKHAIAGRKSDTAQGKKIERQRRVSLTFRNVLLNVQSK